MTGDKGNKLARVDARRIRYGSKLATDPKLDSGSQKRIGDQLRAMYDELMQQPVPDRFKDLARSTGQEERGKGRVSMTPEPEPELREALLAAVPSLRAFAISLSGQVDRADDLVQDTLLRALSNLHRFEPGTNLNAWLFTILRNLFHSEYRKRRREVEDPDGSYAGRLKVQPEQGSHLDFEDFRSALAKLPARSARGAASGRAHPAFPTRKPADICGCAVGTIKSRVNRARFRLASLLNVEDIEDLGPDSMTRAALQG